MHVLGAGKSGRGKARWRRSLQPGTQIGAISALCHVPLTYCPFCCWTVNVPADCFLSLAPTVFPGSVPVSSLFSGVGTA